MPLVRTTMQPYLIQRVSEGEYLDLSRQGLIHSTVPEISETVPVPKPPAPAPAAQANTQEGTK